MTDDEEEHVWRAYEVGSGALVVCEEGNTEAWIRSDTVVPLVDSDTATADGHGPARE